MKYLLIAVLMLCSVGCSNFDYEKEFKKMQQSQKEMVLDSYDIGYMDGLFWHEQRNRKDLEDILGVE